MITVTLYYMDECDRCDEVEAILKSISKEIPHKLVKINIKDDPIFSNYYLAKVPVIKTGPYTLSDPISANDIKATLGASQDRQEYYQQSGDEKYLERIKKGTSISTADKISNWLSIRYMLLFNLAMLLYVGLPFLAPVSLKVGYTAPAKVIYTIYSPLCHQLAFRSWFLFGEQPFYPRELAGIENIKTYEDIIMNDDIDLFDARRFVGNERLGYKVALCQRDVAIYGSILLYGLFFSKYKTKIKSLKWYIWIIIGLIPIAIDGFSQLPGLADALLPVWMPVRESTPIIRTITGVLFGFTTAWYIYPLIEETMLETRRMLTRKIAIINNLDK